MKMIDYALDEQAVRDRIGRFAVAGTPAEMRRIFSELANLPVDRSRVRCSSFTHHGMRVLQVDPAVDDTPPNRAIVHLHGGGYVFGSSHTHERLAIVLALASHSRVLVPDYPLAPEHPWPSQRESIVDLVQTGSRQSSLVLSGDSAGGHLAIQSALALQHDSIDALLLFSPNTLRDYSLSASRQARAANDAMNDPDTDDRLAGLAFGEVCATDAEQNPALADLSGLPALYIDVGANEVLLDDSLLLAQRARDQGVEVTCEIEPDAFHLRQLFAQHWQVADHSLEQAAAWLNDRRSS